MFRIFCVLRLTGVYGTDLSAWCETNTDGCSNYCTVHPEACVEVCKKNPDIAGCKVALPPPAVDDECQKTPEERFCCKEKTAECLACKACKPVTEFCATNRDVTGCDEVCCELGCSEQCKSVLHTTIKIERQCKWKVMNQQFEAFRPTLLQANVEEFCPFMDNYELHLESCQACSRLHQPCNDTYIACGGCCGTPWHSLLGLAINTNHKCDEIKHYFAKRNSAVVACEEESNENKGQPDGTIGMTVHDDDDDDVIDQGTLNSTCETNVTRLECKKIPFVLKFECDDCGNKGTPDLLNQCCDKCIEWSNSLENHPNIDPDIKPYVWCSGCNATQIEPVNPIFPPMPWFGASNYETHTEEKAYKAVETYLEEQVCNALPETCPSATPTTSALPGFLTATPPPSVTPPFAGLGGRRLDKTTSNIADGDCYAEDGGTCASYAYPELIVNMSICTDSRFPYQNTNPNRRQFCFSTQEYANARTGPCDSWCSLSTGGQTDNDGCNGCCGDFNTKMCIPQGGRRLQSPPQELLEWEEADIMCEQFDFAFYERAKPMNHAVESKVNVHSPTDKPVPLTPSETATSETEASACRGVVPGFLGLFVLMWSSLS